MTATARFRINAPDVINETIEGEAIILHLGSGKYYSARGCGAQVWASLTASVSVGEVIDGLVASYDAPRDEIENAVEEFVRYLEDEKLIAAASVEAKPAQPTTAEPDAVKQPFEPPTMEAFCDLQDLLLLDPVHEVDPDQGWPHTQAESGAGAGSRVDAR